MQQSFTPSPTNATLFSTIISNISGVAVTRLFVRCSIDASEFLELGYRAVPTLKDKSFPRIGNLWGSTSFFVKSIEYAAGRVSHMTVAFEWRRPWLCHATNFSSSLVLRWTTKNQCFTIFLPPYGFIFHVRIQVDIDLIPMVRNFMGIWTGWSLAWSRLEFYANPGTSQR